MWISIVTFKFKSADLVAEEKNYFGHHVHLAKQMPGLRMYWTGKLRATRKLVPERYRAGIIVFDDSAAAAAAMMGSAPALIADTHEHMTQLHNHTADVDPVLPLRAGAGRDCFLSIATFQARDPERYRERHVGLARRLPGLSGYAVGPGLAVLEWPSYDAMREAYRSPHGREVLTSADELCADVRLTYVDARTEV